MIKIMLGGGLLRRRVLREGQATENKIIEAKLDLFFFKNVIYIYIDIGAPFVARKCLSRRGCSVA